MTTDRERRNAELATNATNGTYKIFTRSGRNLGILMCRKDRLQECLREMAEEQGYAEKELIARPVTKG